MKPLIEKLPTGRDHSFVARSYRTPHFEVPWHQHPELELILFTEGEGNAFVGNHVGEFATGDIYFLGSNLPHTFQKADPDLVTSAMVIQFLPNCWGDQLLEMPESRDINRLFGHASVGLKLKGSTIEKITPLLRELEFTNGFNRIILLWQCLQCIASAKEYEELSTHEMGALQVKQQARIDLIFQYTIDHYAQNITLDEIASYAGMSVPAFCNYFRKSTKKTYIEFLNEVRIGKACQQLIDTQKSISEIAYENGYNTLANFNKQFLKVRSMQPSQYRKVFSASAEAQASGLEFSGKIYS
ncbi:AraC family transcriptional regulator [Flavihumibacter stibioxidans]|uniref:AraC family transcriptional regulator n=1 Tax=Flavihumibacter stibioxidans TaxID=1834163 RepID=A0ABR7M7G5_9BACT|nr:AraC family transcriptional regulator [Flavihumibacter stibioxidans]MBC6490583.1 AraC family transcriptional regulator [Flavihumibacter stibioxidans]